MRGVRSFRTLLVGALAALAVATTGAFGADRVTTQPFSGKAVNGGTATYSHENGQRTLTLSDDFKAPGSPDPHWQVVDTKGTVYLLDRLLTKGDGKTDKLKRTIVLPAYVPDIARVQLWCAWAEVVLGDAPFSTPVLANR